MFTTLKDVADFLRETPFPIDGMAFDMGREFIHREATDHPCGSACCIGGWIIAYNELDPQTSPSHAVLGIEPDLSLDLAHALCWPETDSGGYTATPEQAADVIDHLLTTGEVNWSLS